MICPSASGRRSMRGAHTAQVRHPRADEPGGMTRRRRQTPFVLTTLAILALAPIPAAFSETLADVQDQIERTSAQLAQVRTRAESDTGAAQAAAIGSGRDLERSKSRLIDRENVRIEEAIARGQEGRRRGRRGAGRPGRLRRLNRGAGADGLERLRRRHGDDPEPRQVQLLPGRPRRHQRNRRRRPRRLPGGQGQPPRRRRRRLRGERGPGGPRPPHARGHLRRRDQLRDLRTLAAHPQPVRDGPGSRLRVVGGGHRGRRQQPGRPDLPRRGQGHDRPDQRHMGSPGRGQRPEQHELQLDPQRQPLLRRDGGRPRLVGLHLLLARARPGRVRHRHAGRHARR